MPEQTLIIVLTHQRWSGRVASEGWNKRFERSFVAGSLCLKIVPVSLSSGLNVILEAPTVVGTTTGVKVYDSRCMFGFVVLQQKESDTSLMVLHDVEYVCNVQYLGDFWPPLKACFHISCRHSSSQLSGRQTTFCFLNISKCSPIIREHLLLHSCIPKHHLKGENVLAARLQWRPPLTGSCQFSANGAAGHLTGWSQVKSMCFSAPQPWCSLCFCRTNTSGDGNFCLRGQHILTPDSPRMDDGSRTFCGDVKVWVQKNSLTLLIRMLLFIGIRREGSLSAELGRRTGCWATSEDEHLESGCYVPSFSMLRWNFHPQKPQLFVLSASPHHVFLLYCVVH